jgi:hypothetical protein
VEADILGKTNLQNGCASGKTAIINPMLKREIKRVKYDE